MASDELQDQVLDYLATHQVMTLATLGERGVWAAAVFYVHNNFDLYFLSAPHTRHAQDMQQHPLVAATIQEDYEDWQAIKGIQLEGTVKRLDGKSRSEAIEMYQRKYPFLSQASPKINAAIQKVDWYQLTPSTLYFVDNSKGFGHRDQLIPPHPLTHPAR